MEYDLETVHGGDGGRAININSSSREQEWIITLSIHAVYLASNGLSYMPIQIKYQNLSNSPFETHMAMTSSVIAFCVYFCAAALQILLVQTNKKLDDQGLLNHVLVCFGILSPISNILVLLPNMIGWVVIVPFIFATTILLAYDMFKLISNYIPERDTSIHNHATPTSESEAHNAERFNIENNNETDRNNYDAVERPTGNNVTG